MRTYLCRYVCCYKSVTKVFLCLWVKGICVKTQWICYDNDAIYGLVRGRRHILAGYLCLCKLAPFQRALIRNLKVLKSSRENLETAIIWSFTSFVQLYLKVSRLDNRWRCFKPKVICIPARPRGLHAARRRPQHGAAAARAQLPILREVTRIVPPLPAPLPTSTVPQHNTTQHNAAPRQHESESSPRPSRLRQH